jgi:hypothetical protein
VFLLQNCASATLLLLLLLIKCKMEKYEKVVLEIQRRRREGGRRGANRAK